MFKHQEAQNSNDFIAFLKKNRGFSAASTTSAQPINLIEFLRDNHASSEPSQKAPTAKKVERFYRSLEDGKLHKVLNTVVSELERVATEDRDDVSVRQWQKHKKVSEQEMIEQGLQLKRVVKRAGLTLGNPVNHLFTRNDRFDPAAGHTTVELSLTWKYTAVAVLMLFLSLGYVNLYPANSQATIAKLDALAAYPINKTIAVARQANLWPAPSHQERFAASLPESPLAINAELKSEFIKNLNQPVGTLAGADSDYLVLTPAEIRGTASGLALSDADIVVLGVDSETEEGSKLLRSVKGLLKKIADKQEKLSLDLNDKLTELLDR